MKALVTYYSGSGQTARVAELIGERLRAAGCNTDLCRVHRVSEPGIFGNIRESRSGMVPALVEPPVDITPYDLVFIGFPIWAGGPASPARAILANLKNSAGKRAAVFAMSGFSRGFESGLATICSAIEAAGARVVSRGGFSRGARHEWKNRAVSLVDEALHAI